VTSTTRMRVSIATDGNRCNSVGQDWDDGFRLMAPVHRRSTDRPLLSPSTSNDLSLALLVAAKEQSPSAPNGVAEVADQLLALPQIRCRSVDTRELEGLTDF
jgi:hypothetical protein